jgi:hypothetical protein
VPVVALGFLDGERRVWAGFGLVEFFGAEVTELPPLVECESGLLAALVRFARRACNGVNGDDTIGVVMTVVVAGGRSELLRTRSPITTIAAAARAPANNATR